MYLDVLSWVGGLCTLLVWTFLVVLACESLHVCTVCVWCCEHERFYMDILVHHIIITFSFICCVLTGSAAQVCSSCCTQLTPGEAMRWCNHQGVMTWGNEMVQPSGCHDMRQWDGATIRVSWHEAMRWCNHQGVMTWGNEMVQPSGCHDMRQWDGATIRVSWQTWRKQNGIKQLSLVVHYIATNEASVNSSLAPAFKINSHIWSWTRLQRNNCWQMKPFRNKTTAL